MQEGEQPEAGAAPQLPQPDTAPAEPAAPPKGRGSVAKAAVVAIVIASAVLLRLFVYETDIVEGASMRPGVQPGDYVLICKLSYLKHRTPRRFDVVTLRSPDGSGEVVIKRVVGLPDEGVWMFGKQVVVDGRPLVEPYADKGRGKTTAPVWVPPDSIYVLGDNRDGSEDSRAWGPVPLSSVRGKALLIYLPLRDAGLIR